MTQTHSNLFILDDELDQLAQIYDRLETENVEQELQALVFSYFSGALNARDQKLDNYARYINSLTATAKVRKEEAARLTALAKTDENLAKRLKDLLYTWFGSKAITKLETKFHKFWIQANGGKPAIGLNVTDPRDLPPQYQKVTVTVDEDAVRADLEAGVVLNFAWLEERGNHLRIK